MEIHTSSERNNFSNVWKLLSSSKVNPPAYSPTFVKYTMYMYRRTQQGDRPHTAPLWIRAKLDRVQNAGYSSWKEFCSLYNKVRKRKEFIATYVADTFHVLVDNSKKAGILVAFLEEGLYNGYASTICDILLELRRSTERQLTEVFRLAKDEALANMLSSFTLYLSQRTRPLTKGDIEAHTNISVSLGTLIDINRMSNIFEMSLKRLHSSSRPFCLWIFLEMLDRDCHIVEQLLSRLQYLIVEEGARTTESRLLVAALITSGVVEQIQRYTKVQKSDSIINPYFSRLYSTMTLLLKPELDLLKKSMSISSDAKERFFFEQIKYHAAMVDANDAQVELVIREHWEEYGILMTMATE